MSEISQTVASRLNKGVLVAIQSRLDPRQPIGATVSVVSDQAIALDLSMGSPGALFREGEKVRLKYWDTEAIYFSDVEVLGTDNQQLSISFPEQPVTLQRRQSQRVLSDFPFAFSVVDAAHSKLVSDEFHEARSNDVSGGGLRFTTDLPIRQGDELKIRLDISPTENLVISAQVVASERVEIDETEFTSVGTEFVRLQPEERNRLVQAVVDAHEEAEQ